MSPPAGRGGSDSVAQEDVDLFDPPYYRWGVEPVEGVRVVIGNSFVMTFVVLAELFLSSPIVTVRRVHEKLEEKVRNVLRGGSPRTRIEAEDSSIRAIGDSAADSTTRTWHDLGKNNVGAGRKTVADYLRYFA